MPVIDWFYPWMTRHQARHPRADWPLAVDASGEESEEAAVFYDGWLNLFIHKGLREADVEAASVRMMGDPPAYLGQHPKAVLDMCRLIMSEASASSEAVGMGKGAREAALLASKGCTDCGGKDGFAVRFRKNPVIPPRSRPYDLFYCRCAYGRWIERTHAAESPDVRKRIPDLADYPALWGEEYRVPPHLIELPAPGRIPAYAGRRFDEPAPARVPLAS